MRLHFQMVPVYDSADAEAALNRFLAEHRVLGVERQLIMDGQTSAWAVCVTWVDKTEAPGAGAKKSRVDYREVLSDAEFAVYAELRNVRKTIAERENVPAYAIFNNEQLATMVQQRVHTDAELAAIPGVGKAKVEKHSAPFLDVLRPWVERSSPASDKPQPSP